MKKKNSIEITKQYEQLRDSRNNRSALAHSFGVKRQKELIHKESFSRTSNVLILHKNVIEGLIANRQVLKCTADELNKGTVFLISSHTRDFLIERFSNIIDEYDKFNTTGSSVIINDLELIVVNDTRLIDLPKWRTTVEKAARSVLSNEYKDKYHKSEEITKIVTDNRYLIEDMAITMAYDNVNTKLIIEDKNMLLLNPFRNRIKPNLIDLIESDLVNIGPILNSIKEENAKSLAMSLSNEERIDATEYYIQLQNHYKQLITNRNRIAISAVDIDNSTEELTGGDNTGMRINPNEGYYRERSR